MKVVDCLCVAFIDTLHNALARTGTIFSILYLRTHVPQLRETVLQFISCERTVNEKFPNKFVSSIFNQTFGA